MTLAEKINNDLKEAMKNKDSFKLGVIRMVKGAMQLEKPNPREELTDDDVIKVISKQIKMRKESIAQFEAANRNDLVEQNKKEIAILEEYMPEQLSGEELNKIINLAKETLEESYDEIKKNITPKFTKELSNNIEMISDGKYKKANFNTDTGLTIEAENGEYIECNKLSIGTIDQLYLSLRLSATKEITKETIPIILDESFAYFDNQRLENVIKYLDSNYNNQIIIFTCTNREKEILDKLNIEYNLVNL